MWQRLTSIQTTNPIIATRGRLLKGSAVCMGIAVLGYIPVAVSLASAWLVWALIGFAGVCVGVFYLAGRGYVAAGGTLIIILLLIMIPLTSTTTNLLDGPTGMFFVLPMIIAGMTISASSILLVGGVSIAILIGIQQVMHYPAGERFVQIIVMLMMLSILLWLIFRSMSRALADAIRRRDEALDTRQALESREKELVDAYENLLLKNDDLERLVSLVRELEVPVIPIKQGVLVVPLVGHLDHRRIERLTSAVLSTVSEQRGQSVIVDVTGVRMVDTDVLQHLQRLTMSIRLLGADAFITGLNSDMARAIVSSGVSLSAHTAGSLQDVLARLDLSK